VKAPAVLLLLSIAFSVRAEEAIRIVALIPPGTSPSAERGIRFGVAEATQTAKLMNRKVSTEIVRGSTVPCDYRAALIIAGSAVPKQHGGGPLIAIGPLREPVSGAFVLRSNARGQRLLWHPRLHRFGAGELNERFLRQTGHAMDEDAWLGWIAVKAVVESALRKSPLERLRFDGHKGVPLSFGPDRVLQQPAYRVTNNAGKETVVED
jgi:hypothetical protein